ncbi:MAG: hypothetical protein VW625_03660 [Perlucidibaca sp.]
MSAIPIDPTVHHFSASPACMGADSHHMLLVVMSDLVRLRDSERDRSRAHMQQEAINRLAWVLDRVEQEVAP